MNVTLNIITVNLNFIYMALSLTLCKIYLLVLYMHMYVVVLLLVDRFNRDGIGLFFLVTCDRFTFALLKLNSVLYV